MDKKAKRLSLRFRFKDKKNKRKVNINVAELPEKTKLNIYINKSDQDDKEKKANPINWEKVIKNYKENLSEIYADKEIVSIFKYLITDKNHMTKITKKILKFFLKREIDKSHNDTMFRDESNGNKIIDFFIEQKILKHIDLSNNIKTWVELAEKSNDNIILMDMISKIEDQLPIYPKKLKYLMHLVDKLSRKKETKYDIVLSVLFLKIISTAIINDSLRIYKTNLVYFSKITQLCAKLQKIVNQLVRKEDLQIEGLDESATLCFKEKIKRIRHLSLDNK